MPCLSMSYPCHKFVRLSGSGPQMKFSRKLHCGSSSAYHGTVFIKLLIQAQQDLFATAAPADSSFAPCLGWASRRRGLLRAGRPRRRGGLLFGGVRRRGVRLHMGFLGSAVQCQGSRSRHSARSGHAQHPLVVRRQQGQKLLEIFRMSAGVLPGPSCNRS